MRPQANPSPDSTGGNTQPRVDPTPPQEVSSDPSAQSESQIAPSRARQQRRDPLDSVVSLIGDESPLVRSALMREFRAAGAIAKPHLLRAAKSQDARVRSHGRKILESLRQEEVVRRLHRHAAGEVPDLESALFLLASLERPQFDARPYRRAMDAMAMEVDKRSRHLNDDLSRGQVLVRYLGGELGIRGNLDSYAHPDNVHLHRVIETRQGLPLSLCAMYSFVAQRCNILTGIVPLPGHVMLRLYGRHQNLIVDPFHGGESKSQEDLIQYLKQHGLRFNPVWMHDASPKMLLLRQIRNLRNAWRLIGRPEGGARLGPLIRQLAD